MEIVLSSISILVTVVSFILIIWRMIPNVGFNMKKRMELDIPRESYTPSADTCAKLFGYSMLFRLSRQSALLAVPTLKRFRKQKLVTSTARNR